MNTGKVFKIKVLVPQTINNGAGQSIVLNKGDVGTAQVYGSIAGPSTGPISFRTNLLIKLSFSNGFANKSINIQSKGSDPSLTWDQNLVQMLTYHENGKPQQFQILSDVQPAIPTTSYSSADGSKAMNFIDKAILTTASISGSIGILAGLLIASKSKTPTAWSYVGHAVLGLVIGSTVGGVATTLIAPDATAQTASGADGQCTGCAKRINTRIDQ